MTILSIYSPHTTLKFKSFQDLGFHSFVWICCLPSFCQIWHVDKTFATYCDWRNIGWSQFCCIRYFMFISIFFTSLVFQGISRKALCVQIDFKRTFQTDTKYNNINHVWSHFDKILVVLKYHGRPWANIFVTQTILGA